MTNNNDFNPRTREGCDPRAACSGSSQNLFQSTHPRRVRLDRARSTGGHRGFQSTHPRRVRRSSHCLVLYRSISIHAPAKGATGTVSSSARPSLISIHAPAKGATSCPGWPRTAPRISIHAPAKGATTITRRGPKDSYDFNPRTREGCDRYGRELRGKYSKISIHAPAKGATRRKPWGLTDESISIHAPAKGATSPDL